MGKVPSQREHSLASLLAIINLAALSGEPPYLDRGLERVPLPHGHCDTKVGKDADFSLVY